MIKHNPFPHERLATPLLSKLNLPLQARLYYFYSTTQLVKVNYMTKQVFEILSLELFLCAVLGPQILAFFDNFRPFL